MKERKASNKLKQKQIETKLLEEQTRKMEDKLSELKRQIDQQKKARSQLGLDNTLTRWQKTSKPTVPLKSYAKQVLQEQKQVHAQYGINQKKITGTKTFETVIKKIKNQQEEEQERNPTKIGTFLKQNSIEQLQIKPQTIGNNFFKAKMNTTSLIKQKTLQQFLQQNFIQQYLHKFREEGILQLEHLRYVSKQQLGQMGVRAGHQIKIMKKIKQQYDKILNGKYQQKKQFQQIPSQKVQFGYGEGDINSYSKEQQQVEQDKSLSKNDHNRVQSDEEDEDYAQEEEDVVVISMPTESVSLQAGDEVKYNCFQCYKNVEIIQFCYDEKYFCTQICMEKYFSKLRKQCPTCCVTFIKTEGYRQVGQWFCSLACCPNHEEIQEMFLEWHASKS